MAKTSAERNRAWRAREKAKKTLKICTEGGVREYTGPCNIEKAIETHLPKFFGTKAKVWHVMTHEFTTVEKLGSASTVLGTCMCKKHGKISQHWHIVVATQYSCRKSVHRFIGEEKLPSRCVQIRTPAHLIQTLIYVRSAGTSKKHGKHFTIDGTKELPVVGKRKKNKLVRKHCIPFRERVLGALSKCKGCQTGNCHPVNQHHQQLFWLGEGEAYQRAKWLGETPVSVIRRDGEWYVFRIQHGVVEYQLYRHSNYVKELVRHNYLKRTIIPVVMPVCA